MNIAKIFVGSVFTNKQGLEFKIISVVPTNRQRYKVRFTKSGYETEANNSNILDGNVTDHLVKGTFKIKVGGIYTNTEGKEFQVLERLPDTETRKRWYRIKFIESGWETETSYATVRQGRIRDKGNNPIVEGDPNIGKVFTNSEGLSYTVIEKVMPGKYKIRFNESGYEREVFASPMKKGNVRDRSVSGFIEINIGDVFTNNDGLQFTIVEKIESKYYKIRFIESGFETDVQDSAIRGGRIKDKLSESLYGTGKIGNVDAIIQNYKKEYTVWRDMIRRCYDTNSKDYNLYGGNGVIVCDRWLTFENFLQDITQIPGYDYNLLMNGEIELDKDSKQYGIINKVYSPETCIFISHKLNSQIANGIPVAACNEYGQIIYANSISDMKAILDINVRESLYNNVQYNGYNIYINPAQIIPAELHKK